MTNEELTRAVLNFAAQSEQNYVTPEDAICPELAGMRLYDAPIFGFASARDSLFTAEFKKPGVIHPEYLSPEEWLPGAKTVISFFLPFTADVKRSNLALHDEPYEPGLPQRCSTPWLHARIEGQLFVNCVSDYIQSLLEAEGYRTVCPTTSGKLRMITPTIPTWSERHAAYAAGLGTFGLSRGLITEKGMAGRFGSVITDAELVPTARPYSSPFEYCVMCGACMRRCPSEAIDVSRGVVLGKDQSICGPYVSGSKLPPHGPHQRRRYGCGKCQVGVPCADGIPQKRPE